MVRAILAGRKTQTRRIVKPQLLGSPWYSLIESQPTRHASWSVGMLDQDAPAKRAPWASDPWVWVIDFKRVAHA
jgi:hypothetical protein